MIYATVNMTVGDYSSTCDQNIVLYRGDKNVEIRFVIKGNRFTVLDSTYAQMIIRRPSSVSIFSEPAAIQNDTVVLIITEDMIDELKEIGEYTFQIRLYDNSMNARATLPPCNNCLIINQPIAVEGEALVNAAMVNDSAVLAAVSDIPEEEIFTDDNAYNRTVWVDGDIITDARMNKIENALYYINEKGGGGTATAPYISTSIPETIMVGSGEDFILDLDFSSPNLGKGTLKVFVNDVDVMSTKIDQGISNTTISGSFFAKGTNMVVVYVLDRVGMMSNSLTFYVRYGSTEVSSTFDPYVSYDYGATVRYYFTPTALDTSLQLTFFMEIDGVTQSGVPCVSDVRSYYTFPTNLTVGNHECRAWVTDGSTNSNILKFNLIILDATSLVVASDTSNPTVEEGTQLVLDYKVYMKNNTSFVTKTYVDGTLVNTGTCTLETAYYRTTSLTEGTHTVKVEVLDVTETKSDFVVWTVTVTASTYTMLSPAKAGSLYIATAYSKSNVDENKEVWRGSSQDDEDIDATLTNFSFNSENGWVNDELVISGNSWVEIPIAPLANNAQYGFTLDIEFSTKPIGVEDSEVLTLWNETDNCGIKITTEQLIMRSKTGNQCNLYFPEDETVSAIFVIDRDEKTAKIYLNGVMCSAFALSDYEAAGQKYLEDFTVNSNIFLGGYNKNGYCKVRNIRVYEVALATNEILDNFMSNVKDKAAQRELVEFQKGNTLPTMTIYCDFSGLGKDDKKPCNIVYNSPDVNLYGESFTLDGKHSMLQYQGTSSMQYPIKNYRINPRNADGKVKLDPFNNGVGESRFTLKADFMSSGHWQNTGMAKFVNDCLYNYNPNDEKSMNPRKWYDLQNGGSIKGTRETINGFPCRLILVNDGETALLEGQQEPTPGNTKDMGVFNFNNDKDNVNTLGLDTDIFPNCISYEVTANSDTSAGAFVPYSEERIINAYLDGTNLYTNYMYQSEFTTAEVNFDGAVSTNSRITWYRNLDSNAWQMSNVANGVFNVAYCSEPYFQLLFFSIGQKENITINGVTYKLNYVSSKEELYEEAFSIIIDENAELSYLQNSFELRYPDAKEVGDDYGYLGMGEVKKIFNVFINNNKKYTTFVKKDFFGNTITLGDGIAGGVDSGDGTGNFGGWVSTNPNTAYDISKFTGPYISFNVTNATFPIVINGIEYYEGETIDTSGDISKRVQDPYVDESTYRGLKRVIDWVGNCTDEEFVADFEKYFNKQYVLRYYLLVIVCGMVDNLGKNMMLDTWDGQIWYPRFYDMDTICSYDNSGEIKFDVDIEMAQGYWNTSSSRLWTKVRDLFHDDLVATYKDLRQNNFSYEKFMSYFYGKQIAQIPQTYYNKDYDVKYAPYATEYMGKAHGDGYEHLKRWLKRRLIFTDTLFDYAPSYENDKITIRANTLDLMNIEIETYTPVYQHVSFYNGQMSKEKVDGKVSTIFSGTAQTATDQEVLIYGGSNIKRIKGLSSMNPNSMLIGNASKLVELDISNCPILSVVNSNKANFAPHTYLSKLDISNCPQLGGQLNISNSPLLQEVNALGTSVDNILFPTSVRNLETLRVPNTVTSLTLNDAGLLYTIEMEEGNNLQSIALTNCNNLTETINFDLTKTPTVLLDNSFNGEELYMSETTNLTLKNMPSLQRVIFTPNSEYSAFDINNVLNGANYKITTFNNPMMTDFITTAPYRLSYKNGDYGDITPNTAFTANTLDLADTQFQNVKFLCTTDIYNLKVPTTMKNFYCDSAFDIDTDVIVDGNYEVIHNELIEPYTTNYEGEVYRYKNINGKYTPNIIPSSASGSLIFNMYSNNTTQPTSTSPYMWDLTGLKLEDFYTYGMNNWVKPNDGGNQLVSLESITMPQRMSGYSVRLVNAYITPDEYPTMLYPKLIDTTLPITGKLDYTAYNGSSLAWAYAYTTGDVTISPLGSQDQGNITQDYNKLYGTDYVDIVDVWAYKDDDFSRKSTNEAITEAYIELTSANYKTRIDEVLQWYPNCTDLYFFEDGSVTSLRGFISNGYYASEVNNTTYGTKQVKKITFMEGYFSNLTNLTCAFTHSNISEVYNIPNTVTLMSGTFYMTKLTYISNLPSSTTSMFETFRSSNIVTIPNIPNTVTDLGRCFQASLLNCEINLSECNLSSGGLENAFYGCSSLTNPPILPSNYKGSIANCFQGCTSLTQAPAIPQGVTNMEATFQGCTSLTTAPAIPTSVINMSACFRDSGLIHAPILTNPEIQIGYAYWNCTSLKSAYITLQGLYLKGYTDSVWGCTALETITFVGEWNRTENWEKIVHSSIPSTVFQSALHDFFANRLADLTKLEGPSQDLSEVYPIVNSYLYSDGSVYEDTRGRAMFNIPLSDYGSFYITATSLYSSVIMWIYDATGSRLGSKGNKTDGDITWTEKHILVSDLLEEYPTASYISLSSFSLSSANTTLSVHAVNKVSETLTLGETYLAYLTEEEIAQAVAKGWTIQ